jgi:hypothetical protein
MFSNPDHIFIFKPRLFSALATLNELAYQTIMRLIASNDEKTSLPSPWKSPIQAK